MMRVRWTGPVYGDDGIGDRVLCEIDGRETGVGLAEHWENEKAIDWLEMGRKTFRAGE